MPWDWIKVRKYFDTESIEIVFGERLRGFWSPFRRISKTEKPRIQAKSRIFNGNSRSARTAPLKIPTPAPRVFVLLNSAPKSPKIPSAALRKAHPAICIRSIFCSHPAGTITDNSKFNKQKTKTELFRLQPTVYPVSAFETGNYTRFQTSVQNTVSVSADKVLSSFLLFWIWNCEWRKRSRDGRREWWRTVKQRRHLERVLCALMYRCAVSERKCVLRQSLLPSRRTFLYPQIQIPNAKNFIKSMNFMSILKTMLAVLFFPYYNFEIVTGSLMQDNRICGLAERHLQWKGTVRADSWNPLYTSENRR